jgi:Peptidase family M28
MVPPLITFLLFALLELVVWERLTPPPVRPADAPPAEFSAARAEQVLERLLREGQPHPTGSVAQQQVRARLLAELEQLGLKPELQSGVACSPEGVCAELHNVLAELPGADLPGSGIGPPQPTSRVLLSAHYDSVPSGPGAGDDGQSVASLLELARALRDRPARSGIWLLFTDGEELGLLGARLFAAEHPLLQQLRISLNLEARGNRGPSLMFETGAQSSSVVRSYAHAPRPVASSLFAPVYRSLPNDTDFSIFIRRGLQGINLAFVGGVENYHTPHDTLDRLDWRSSQQQGDAALATLRALAPEGASARTSPLVYFDVLTAGLVTLSGGWMLPCAGIGLVCFALALRHELRRGQLRQHARAALALLLGLAVPVLASALIGTVLQLVGGLPFAVVATPQPFLLGVVLLVAGGQALACSLLRSEEQRQALWDVTWLCWLGLGLGLAVVLPDASYLLVLPGLAAGLIRLGHQLRGAARVSDAGMLAAALASGLLVLPVLSLLPSTIELSAPVALAVAFALGLSPLGPLLGPALRRPRLRTGLLAGGAVLALSELALPAYSAEVPQRLSLVLEADAAEAHWLAEGNSGQLPSALRTAAEFASRPSRPHPWPGFARGLMYVASAPAPVAPPPVARIHRQGRSLRIELDAPQDLWALGLRFERSAPIASAHWQGHALEIVSDEAGQRVLLVLGMDRAVSIDLDFSSETTELPDVLAIALGLPEAGGALAAARGPKAVASGFGDMTVLHLEPRLTNP